MAPLRTLSSSFGHNWEPGTGEWLVQPFARLGWNYLATKLASQLNHELIQSVCLGRHSSSISSVHGQSL